MLRFTVPNMACGGCAKGVAKAVQGVDANARIETDTTAREVRVESSKANEAALLAALQDAGYPAQLKVAPIG